MVFVYRFYFASKLLNFCESLHIQTKKYHAIIQKVINTQLIPLKAGIVLICNCKLSVGSCHISAVEDYAIVCVRSYFESDLCILD